MLPNHPQQLQPYGSSSNSAQSSPLKRVPQAVSPLASPMESRRVFMASAQQQNSAEQILTGQHSSSHQPQPAGLSAIQLGYALPTCRLLVDPQTGQQFFVPTAPAQPVHTATPAPSAAYFQPTVLFYNQPSTQTALYSAATPHHVPHPSTAIPTTNSGTFIYTSQHAQQPSTISSTGFIPHQSQQILSVPLQQSMPIPSAVPSSTSAVVPNEIYAMHSLHRSQSPPDRYQENAFTTVPYHVEMPPSTVGSTYGDNGCVDEQQQYFRRQEYSRLSTESKGSCCSSMRRNFDDSLVEETYNNPEESYYCSNSPHHQLKPTLQQLGTKQHQHQMNLSISAGGSSSESTSGFVSATRSRTFTFADEPRSPQPPQSPCKEHEMQTAFFERRQQQVNDERHNPMQSAPAPSVPRRMKAIRMDIDLNRPMSPPENASTSTRQTTSFNVKQKNGVDGGRMAENSSVSVRATVLRAAPSTAFTISFNDNNSELGEVSISKLSLQEAARQAPKSKRLLARRNMPLKDKNKQCFGAAQDSGSESGDPKRWLFRKMMMGRVGRPNSTDDGETDETPQDYEDMASEAGTYVVENNNNTKSMSNSIMTSSKLSESQTTPKKRSESTSSTSRTTPSSRTSSEVQPTRSPNIVETMNKQQHQKHPTIRPNIALASTTNVTKRSLMSDLRQLRETGSGNQKNNEKLSTQQKSQQQQQPMATAVGLSATNRLCRANQSGKAGMQQSQQGFFRRNDGGRFSMRPSTNPSNSGRNLPTVVGVKGQALPPSVPIRIVTATTKGKQQATPERSPEMIAWLRRKEYNPRKAAAIEQQQQLERAQLLKAQLSLASSARAELATQHCEEAFVANRSISAAPSTTLTVTKPSPFARWQAAQRETNDKPINHSCDNLSRVGGDSLDEESLSCSSNLQRTVDELTQKCHKSIAMLKLCNKSTLSPSVEQFLERVVATPSENENISDRLERMGSAFDAIQKYLEEQTASGKILGSIGTGNNNDAGTSSYLNTGTYRKKNSAYALAKIADATKKSSALMANKKEEDLNEVSKYEERE